MKKLIFIPAIFLVLSCEDFENAELLDLRVNFEVHDTSMLSARDMEVVDPVTGKLNYIKPLYCCWNACKVDHSGTFGTIQKSLAVIGDHDKLEHPIGRCAPEFKDNENEPKIISMPARAEILKQFKDHRVVMFNESEEQVQSRAFLLDMLDDLKKAGATHLALERLNNCPGRIDCGSYKNFIVEPVYIQIIRKAKTLGYELVAYDDTSSITRGDDREKWQALNLYQKIRNGRQLAKTVVLATYSQISEDSLSALKTMAYYFSMISKTDPLTVDQLRLNENSSLKDIARRKLDSVQHKKITEPVVVPKLVTPLIFRPGNFLQDFQYDFCVYHPTSEYVFRRPKWLLTSGKEMVAVTIPENIKPVLVQAYLKSEIQSKTDYDYVVPVDQGFFVEKMKVHLFLEKANAYNIVFRDKWNRIIRTEDVSVL